MKCQDGMHLWELIVETEYFICILKAYFVNFPVSGTIHSRIRDPRQANLFKCSNAFLQNE